MYEDNSACIEWGNNVIGGREQAKHIDIHKHFAHEVIRNGEMKLIKVLTMSRWLTSSARDSICHSSRSGQPVLWVRSQLVFQHDPAVDEIRGLQHVQQRAPVRHQAV